MAARLVVVSLVVAVAFSAARKNIDDFFEYIDYVDDYHQNNMDVEATIWYINYLQQMMDTYQYYLDEWDQMMQNDITPVQRYSPSQSTAYSANYGDYGDYYNDYYWLFMEDPFKVGDTVKVFGLKSKEKEKYNDRTGKVTATLPGSKYTVKMLEYAPKFLPDDILNDVPEKNLKLSIPAQPFKPLIEGPVDGYHPGDLVRITDGKYKGQTAHIKGFQGDATYQVEVQITPGKPGSVDVIGIKDSLLKPVMVRPVPVIKPKKEEKKVKKKVKKKVLGPQWFRGINRPRDKDYKPDLEALKQEMSDLNEAKGGEKITDFSAYETSWNKQQKKGVVSRLRFTEVEFYVIQMYITNTKLCKQFRRFYWDPTFKENVYQMHNAMWNAMHKKGRLELLFKNVGSNDVWKYFYHGSDAGFETLKKNIHKAKQLQLGLNEKRKQVKLLDGTDKEKLQQEINKEQEQYIQHGPMSVTASEYIAKQFSQERNHWFYMNLVSFVNVLKANPYMKEMIGWIPRDILKDNFDVYASELETIISDFDISLITGFGQAR